MMIIDPHIHMVWRTTDDYQALAMSGIHTVTEPASWPGFKRGAVETFRCYFYQLAVSEPARAERFGVRHYCWIGLNARETDDLNLADEVLDLIPEYLFYPNVVGVGAIGPGSGNSRNELSVFEKQLDMAAEQEQLILIDSPALEEKLTGTRLILSALANQPRIDPGRVLIDHAEEHTVGEILDRGMWAGLTLSRDTQGSPQRAADTIELFGSDRICINSSADWSVSDPLATVKAANEMRRRGHSENLIHRIFFDNPNSFLTQCPKFEAA